MGSEPLIPENPDRQGGILGKAQRKFVLGYPPSYAESRIHQRIRQDLIHSLLDAPLLSKISDKNLGLVVDNLRENTVDEDTMKRRLIDSEIYESDFGISTRYSSDLTLTIPEGVYGIEQGDYERLDTYELDEAVIDLMSFLFRIVDQEQESVESFIEDAIPEAYHRYNQEENIDINVRFDGQDDDK